MSRPRDHELVFSGAGTMYVSQKGRHVRVLEAPTAAVFIGIDDHAECKVAAGQGVNDQDGFKKLAVRSAVAQTVRLRVSETLQEDNSTSVQVNATAQVEGATETANTPAVTVPAGGTALIIAGDPDRLQVRIAIPSDAAGPLWIGANAVGDEEGGLFEPGIVDYVDGEMALYAHNPHATDDVLVSVMPLRRP